MQDGTLDYTKHRKEISDSVQMQLKLRQITDEWYLPQVKNENLKMSKISQWSSCWRRIIYT